MVLWWEIVAGSARGIPGYADAAEEMIAKQLMNLSNKWSDAPGCFEIFSNNKMIVSCQIVFLRRFLTFSISFSLLEKPITFS